MASDRRLSLAKSEWERGEQLSAAHSELEKRKHASKNDRGTFSWRPDKLGQEKKIIKLKIQIVSWASHWGICMNIFSFRLTIFRHFPYCFFLFYTPVLCHRSHSRASCLRRRHVAVFTAVNMHERLLYEHAVQTSETPTRKLQYPSTSLWLRPSSNCAGLSFSRLRAHTRFSSKARLSELFQDGGLFYSSCC